ncbi:MAG: hypothetical protein COA60_004445 [Robiginitomaculum sp.]|nr:hypothetical protein [Robiginitomaculum sp.]
MKLNELEKTVLIQYMEDLRIPLESVDIIEEIELESRDFTGVGFLSTLKQPLTIKVGEATTGDGDVNAILNSSMHTGYLFIVRDGYLDTIEGYNYEGEPWPKEISNIEIYKIEPEQPDGSDQKKTRGISFQRFWGELRSALRGWF